MIVARLSLALTPLLASTGEGFAGGWMTSFGPMELSAKGKAVTGTYGWSKDGKVEGKLSGDALELEWSNPHSRGEARLSLWKDGRTFGGQSTVAGGSSEFWGGYRIERALAEPRPGEVTDGQTELFLNYHLRVPFDYDPEERYTALALFHGSNANARDYVEGFPKNWPKHAERYVLVGFDGERLSPGSRDPVRAYNATYVNFSGDKVGDPWVHMQTPALVAAALEELSRSLPIERWYVGGHSQGGFLTYAVAMYYPELVAGAFPVAGGLLVQCVPRVFDDEEVRAAQRRIPFALVHGRKDDVVEFGMTSSALDSFQDGGFPMLRLFDDPKAGHPWAFLPVDDALDWLDAMNGVEPEGLVALARASVEAQRWRDATGALGRLAALDPPRAKQPDVAELLAAVDAAATPRLAALEKGVASGKGGEWVDEFWSFRAEFADAPSARDLMKGYARLRAKHEEPASNFFWKARSEEDPKKRRELSREIVERYYASSFYPLAKGWAE